jgi:hypothetical protein
MRSVNKQQTFQQLMESQINAGTTYVDAMVEYMTENQLEAKQVAKLISPGFLEKVTVECIANNVIKDDGEKGSALPL